MGRSERLIGRRGARDVLDLALREARSGAGQLALVSGEAGIGKSALTAWLIDRAAPACRVLRGFCWEGGGAPPYWPWTQVLRATGLSAAALEEAHWLVDGGVPAAPGDALAASDARFRLFDAVARSLAGLAAAPGRPLVVVLDDLHWADEPSLALLSFVSRALPTSPVLTVGAYRDDEAPSPLQELACRALHVPLLGLAPAEVEDMVEAVAGRRPAPSVTARIRQRSGGNPLFVAELTRLLQTQDPSEPPGHLPAGVVDTVRRRLARLPTACVRLLDWAAVAGRDIDVGLLVAGGAAEDEATALDTLPPARHAGVVTERETLQFTHDLYREAIIEGQRADTNTAINLALGRALASRSRPGGAARIAAHLLRAGPRGRQDAIDHCLLAAQEATARLGHDDAATSTAGSSRSSTRPTRGGARSCSSWRPPTRATVRPIPHGAATGRPPTWPGASTTSRPSPTPRSACSRWDTGPEPRTSGSSTCSARRPSASTSPGTGRRCSRACSPRPPAPCGTARTPSPTPSWWSPPAGPWTSPSRRATPPRSRPPSSPSTTRCGHRVPR